MAEAVQGKKIVYLYRLLEEAATEDGANMALVTENGRSVSKDADSTATKDGSIRTPGVAEIEITATAILAKDDVLIGKLEQAMLNDKTIEVWEANLDQPASGSGNANKFAGTYYQGYLTSFSKSSPSDGFVECSMTFGLSGNGASGNVTVTAEQQEAAVYTFADTLHTGS